MELLLYPFIILFAIPLALVLREEDIAHSPGLITGHEGIVQTQIARYM